ncbi:MAG: hypothetical protein JNJ88_08240 [Planctomycetes bacterium]|nr:hypothetical protein [Planctomycetota bacterium]
MSDPQNPKKAHAPADSGSTLPPEAAPQSAAPIEESKPAPPAKFVFKVVRADPKNAFDFEDVADK